MAKKTAPRARSTPRPTTAAKPIFQHLHVDGKTTADYQSLGQGVLGWFDQRLPLISTLKHATTDYPAPRNLNYFWNFGSLALFALVLQIVTGLFLAMYYKPDVALAFGSIQTIMRDVNWGWLIRCLHMVGASFFFMVVYIHIARGLYYGSYKSPREILWGMGVIILLLMMATAFMGYVLPWGQMSYWGAKVITNLFSAVPFIGPDLVIWMLGGYNVNDATLTRFFAIHFVLPFVIVGIVGLHLIALHQVKSNNPVGIDLTKQADYIPFHPYYTIKDVFGLMVYLLPFLAVVFFAPYALGHPDNYIPADALKTPPHIVPEWYFLPFYAILRSITFDIGIPFTSAIIFDAKLLGVAAMGGSILILLLLPWLDNSPVRSARFRPLYRSLLMVWFANVFFLGYIGMLPADAANPIAALLGQVVPATLLDGVAKAAEWLINYGSLGLVNIKELTFSGLLTLGSTAFYFAFFLALPLINRFERRVRLPNSI